MDAFERCGKKIDYINERLSGRIVAINATITEIRQGTRRTVLLIQILWGMGLPVTFFVTLYVVARMY